MDPKNRTTMLFNLAISMLFGAHIAGMNFFVLFIARDSPLGEWIYEPGIVACISLFAIQSASFFLYRTRSWRFPSALLIVFGLSAMIGGFGILTNLLPHYVKISEIGFAPRLVLISWLTIPPWLMAVLFTVFSPNRSQHNIFMAP